jgi:hypothetical protein
MKRQPLGGDTGACWVRPFVDRAGKKAGGLDDVVVGSGGGSRG